MLYNVDPRLCPGTHLVLPPTLFILLAMTLNGTSNGTAAPKCRPASIHANRKMRVLVIGAGASGIYMAYRLKYYFADVVLDVYEKKSTAL
jgi:hypothetical protein